MRTLLMGMGNPILSDDAVGIRLVGDFSRKLSNPAGLEIVNECTAAGVDLLQIIEGYDRLLLVDSIKTSEGVPGDWFHFTAERLRETAHLATVHDANFATVLSLGRQLGMSLPSDREIHIFAVVILDDLTFSERMTDKLEKVYPIYSKEIFAQLSGLLHIPLAKDSSLPEKNSNVPTESVASEVTGNVSA